MIKLPMREESLDTVCKLLIGLALNLDATDKMYVEKLCPIIEFLEATMEPNIGASICYLKVLDKLPQEMRRQMPRHIYKYIQNNLFEIEETMGEKVSERHRPEVIAGTKVTLLDANGNEIYLPPKQEPSKLVLQ